MGTKDQSDKASLKRYKEGLPGFLDTMGKALENFPYPPGEEYRELGQQEREQAARIINAGLKEINAKRAQQGE